MFLTPHPLPLSGDVECQEWPAWTANLIGPPFDNPLEWGWYPTLDSLVAAVLALRPEGERLLHRDHIGYRPISPTYPLYPFDPVAVSISRLVFGDENAENRVPVGFMPVPSNGVLVPDTFFCRGGMTDFSLSAVLFDFYYQGESYKYALAEVNNYQLESVVDGEHYYLRTDDYTATWGVYGAEIVINQGCPQTYISAPMAVTNGAAVYSNSEIISIYLPCYLGGYPYRRYIPPYTYKPIAPASAIPALMGLVMMTILSPEEWREKNRKRRKGEYGDNQKNRVA
jgi:hypothetical protein